MKQLKILYYFLKLIRWPNILIVMVTMALMRYCVIKPMLAINYFTLQLSFTDFAILVSATVLITAAGYIINDYFDRKTDLINRPYKVIVGRFIKRRMAMMMHTIFNVLGVVAGFYLSYKNNLTNLSIIFVLATGILWFYSTSYKRQVFIGNLIVAVLTALVPILVIVFELPLLNIKYGEILKSSNFNFQYLAIWVVGFAYFAFITTLIREIIKDAEDLEGDQAFGRNSIPIAFGMKWTKAIVVSLLILLILSLVSALIYFINDYYSLIYLSVCVIIPSILLIYKILTANKKEDYTFSSGLLKIVMIFGVLYSIMVNYIVSTQL